MKPSNRSGQFGIQGFPTIKVFPSDKKKSPVDYQGARDAASMVSFAISQLPSTFYTVIDDKKNTIDNFLASSTLAKAVLFSKKSSTPPLWKALAIEYDARLLLGEVKPSQKDLQEKYNIATLPALVVFTKDGTQVNYDGVLKNAPVSKFLDEYAVEKKGKDKEEGKPEVKKEEPCKKSQLIAVDPTIPQVTVAKDFEKHCASTTKTCVLSLLVPSEDEPLEPMLEILSNAKKSHGSSFAFSYVDVSTGESRYPELLTGKFGLSGEWPLIQRHVP